VVKTRQAGAEAGDGLGTLTGERHEVVASDGVPLCAEVDEVAPYATEGNRRAATGPTLVFVHGYALNLDCWHFQRTHFRGKHRMVFYDQRSHGDSGRSPKENATIDQLGDDLHRVIETLVPEGPVILIGHSMGGMAVMALAEQHPELFGDTVVGTALIATTAGGMHTNRIISPFLPERIAGQITPRIVAGLARAPQLVDSARRRGSNVGFLVTGKFAFGDDVPPSYVEFVDEMLAKTSFDVLAEFFPNFDALDKYSVLDAFERIPTAIVCGTKDLLTSIGHSRKMASRIPGSELTEVSGAGHMVILKRAAEVNAVLDQLVADAGHQPEAVAR
jgi:pimeloyl-ACP methyl ester carboxylesterase